MIISRPESWGCITYDTNNHFFDYEHDNGADKQPYVSRPLVLNVDLTLNCNMQCHHCVAKDMRKYLNQDLVVSRKLIKEINRSPFMVIVITGGEPFLREYETPLLDLVSGLKGKGIVVDTNGTILPSKEVLNILRSRKAMVRISLDSIRCEDELHLRYYPGSRSYNEDVFDKKLKLVPSLRKAGIKVAIQSVLHKMNQVSIEKIPDKLIQWGVGHWFIQRLIPNNEFASRKMFQLKTDKYELMLDKFKETSGRLGIRCVAKKDRRHNCVFLLVGDGEIYTQGEKEGVKLRLGRIGKIPEYDYFQYVSASEHSARYYEIIRHCKNRR